MFLYVFTTYVTHINNKHGRELHNKESALYLTYNLERGRSELTIRNNLDRHSFVET